MCTWKAHMFCDVDQSSRMQPFHSDKLRLYFKSLLRLHFTWTHTGEEPLTIRKCHQYLFKSSASEILPCATAVWRRVGSDSSTGRCWFGGGHLHQSRDHGWACWRSWRPHQCWSAGEQPLVSSNRPHPLMCHRHKSLYWVLYTPAGLWGIQTNVLHSA